MKKSNYFIIGAVIIAAIFFFRKKALKKIIIDNTLTPVPIFVYPEGITEGMRVVASNGDGTQFLIKEGKKYALTLDVWAARGYDPYIVVQNKIIDLVPYGGLL